MGEAVKPMEMERAVEIIKPLVGWMTSGFMGKEPGPVPTFHLADALEATRIIQDYKPEPDAKGRVKRCMCIDPRGLAALYVMGHYLAGPAGDVDPVISGGGKALCLVEIGPIGEGEG